MKHLNLWAALGAVFYLTSLAIAQEAGGMFSGRVVDPTGAGVPGAEVVAVHAATGVTCKATSGSDGGYALPNLRIGAYDLSVTKAGFRRTVRKGVELHVSEHVGVELPLQIGELAQEVSVTANVEQVQTESSAQGGLITGDQVRELQMNGRGFTTLLELLPGVASDNPDRNDPIAPTLSMSVNGAGRRSDRGRRPARLRLRPLLRYLVHVRRSVPRSCAAVVSNGRDPASGVRRLSDPNLSKQSTGARRDFVRPQVVNRRRSPPPEPGDSG